MAVYLSAARDRLSKIVEECPPDALPDLLGELARAQALVQVRLQPPTSNGALGIHKLDQYLSADDVADRLPVDRHWVYAHRHELGGFKIDGRVMFPERRLCQYMEALQSEAER